MNWQNINRRTTHSDIKVEKRIASAQNYRWKIQLVVTVTYSVLLITCNSTGGWIEGYLIQKYWNLFAYFQFEYMGTQRLNKHNFQLCSCECKHRTHAIIFNICCATSLLTYSAKIFLLFHNSSFFYVVYFHLVEWTFSNLYKFPIIEGIKTGIAKLLNNCAAVRSITFSPRFYFSNPSSLRSLDSLAVVMKSTLSWAGVLESCTEYSPINISQHARLIFN